MYVSPGFLLINVPMPSKVETVSPHTLGAVSTHSPHPPFR